MCCGISAVLKLPCTDLNKQVRLHLLLAYTGSSSASKLLLMQLCPTVCSPQNRLGPAQGATGGEGRGGEACCKHCQIRSSDRTRNVLVSAGSAAEWSALAAALVSDAAADALRRRPMASGDADCAVLREPRMQARPCCALTCSDPAPQQLPGPAQRHMLFACPSTSELRSMTLHTTCLSCAFGNACQLGSACQIVSICAHNIDPSVAECLMTAMTPEASQKTCRTSCRIINILDMNPCYLGLPP